MILLRDFLKDLLTNFFGEEMGGGQGDADPLKGKPSETKETEGKLRRNKKTPGTPKVLFSWDSAILQA